MSAVREDMPLFERHQVRPFGVNPAPAASHADYAARLRLPFPLLSDPALAAAKAYGAVRPDGSAVARSVVLIDRDGTIVYSQAGAPGAEIVLEALR
ncbi:MAG TPA: redoxin domain-containing protein [Gemmatimonadales bacterium]|nr:redoxin domain-containing protein [Gemmatimonadales bacterium]